MIYEVVNMIYSNLAFLADADTAGAVVGARVPIIFNQCRADTAASRRLSAAAACFTRKRWRAIRTAC